MRIENLSVESKRSVLFSFITSLALFSVAAVSHYIGHTFIGFAVLGCVLLVFGAVIVFWGSSERKGRSCHQRAISVEQNKSSSWAEES